MFDNVLNYNNINNNLHIWIDDKNYVDKID